MIDQQISVTAGEILTIQIENGGSYGLGAQGKASGGSGSTGGTTKLLRGETELFTVNGGTGGNGGAYSLTSGTHGAGGKGGTLNGNDGEAGQNINYSNVDPELRGASGGAKATSYLFGDYGAGGKGGRGSYTISFASYAGKNGSEGTNGALVICFGNVNFSDISYEKTTIPHLYLSDWRVSTYIGDIWHRASFKMLTSYNPLAYNLETFKQMVGTNVGSIDHMIFKYNILSYSNSSDYLYTANIKNNVFSCTFGNAGSGDRSVSEDDYTINIILNGKYQIF